MAPIDTIEDMTILEPRLAYRPFRYPWAYENFHKQSRELFWRPDTISFADDIQDYKNLPAIEQEFMRKVFTFFVQADADISAQYVDRYLPVFPQPEVRMMLLSFASMESTHIDAYSKLIESLGLGDYDGFLKYPEMREKHEYLTGGYGGEEAYSIMWDIAVGSAFGEGLQLFGTFAMLLSYPQRGLFKGMRDVVAWSLRDETLHVKGMIQLFETLRREYPSVWTDEFKRSIYQACRDMVELEDRFVSLVYDSDMELPNLPKADIHEYIRYLADHRLGQLGLKPNYYVKSNPIPWLDMYTLSLREDLFNNTGTAYQHSSFDVEALW